MASTQYIVPKGPISIVGIADAGAMHGRTPDVANDERWRSWPAHITVPKAFGGSGNQVDVRRCFEEAFAKVHRSLAGSPKCDGYFLDLGKTRAELSRRTLTQLLGYKLTFFRYGSTDASADFKANDGKADVTSGIVLSSNLSTGYAMISISAYAARSPTSLAATIIHELAHVAGAPGRPSDGDWAAMNAEKRAPYFGAENALKHCGLEKQHSPHIYGEILERFQRRMNIGGLA